MTKLCTECKHFSSVFSSTKLRSDDYCYHENNRSLVDGSARQHPEHLRYSHASTSCGEIGRWWEPKGAA